MNYGTSTRFTPEEVLRMAEAFFSSPSLGLEVVVRRAHAVQMAGHRGRVDVRVHVTDDATEAFLTAEGLDYPVRQFLVEICEEAHLHREGSDD